MASSNDAGTPTLQRTLAGLVDDEDFGDSRRLIALAEAMQDFALEVLADHLPRLKIALSDANARVRAALPRDPTIRAATESAWHDHLEGRLATQHPVETLVASSFDILQGSSTPDNDDLPLLPPPLAASLNSAPVFGPPVVPQPIHVMMDRLPNTPHGVAFERMFRRVFGEYRSRPRLVSPEPRHVGSLQMATELLDAAVPELADVTLRHAALVCLVAGDGIFQSASMRQMPRTIFLSEYAFKDSRTTAEALLHEAIHLKLYDIYLLRSVLRRGYSSQEAPTITSIWNPPPNNEWAIDRALAAFHVYVHLTAFYTAALERAARLNVVVPPREIEEARVNAGRRAQYLAKQVLDRGIGCLTDEGVRFAKWLATYLDRLDDGAFDVLPQRPRRGRIARP